MKAVSNFDKGAKGVSGTCIENSSPGGYRLVSNSALTQTECSTL